MTEFAGLEPMAEAMVTRLDPVAEAMVIRPGDTLVVRVPLHITAELAAEFRAQLEERLPGVKTVLVAADQVLVYRPGDDTDVAVAP